ncbi:MAG: hypothetical protein AAGI30_05805 [Planctomycetota bacterium]
MTRPNAALLIAAGLVGGSVVLGCEQESSELVQVREAASELVTLPVDDAESRRRDAERLEQRARGLSTSDSTQGVQDASTIIGARASYEIAQSMQIEARALIKELRREIEAAQRLWLAGERASRRGAAALEYDASEAFAWIDDELAREADVADELREQVEAFEAQQARLSGEIDEIRADIDRLRADEEAQRRAAIDASLEQRMDHVRQAAELRARADDLDTRAARLTLERAGVDARAGIAGLELARAEDRITALEAARELERTKADETESAGRASSADASARWGEAADLLEATEQRIADELAPLIESTVERLDGVASAAGRLRGDALGSSSRVFASSARLEAGDLLAAERALLQLGAALAQRIGEVDTERSSRFDEIARRFGARVDSRALKAADLFEEAVSGLRELDRDAADRLTDQIELIADEWRETVTTTPGEQPEDRARERRNVERPDDADTDTEADQAAPASDDTPADDGGK